MSWSTSRSMTSCHRGIRSSLYIRRARTTPLKWGSLVLDGHGRLMTSCHRGIHTSLHVRWPSVAKGHGCPGATCASNGQNIIHTLENNWTITSALPSAGGRSAGCTSVVKNTDVRERPHPTYMDVLVSWSTGRARTTPLKWGPCSAPRTGT